MMGKKKSYVTCLSRVQESQSERNTTYTPMSSNIYAYLQHGPGFQVELETRFAAQSKTS